MHLKSFCIFIFLIIPMCNFAILAIPLGVNCAVASVLRHYNIRTQSLPFDWIISEHEGICKILNEDFAHFLNPENLYIDPSGLFVVDSYYNTKFLHDFPFVDIHTRNRRIDDNFMEYWEEINAKYLRRIRRFQKIIQDAMKDGEKVFFIREGYITKNQAIEIQTILRKCYPSLDFELIIFTYDTKEDYAWNVPGIINRYSYTINFALDPFLNRPEWKETLVEVGLYRE